MKSIDVPPLVMLRGGVSVPAPPYVLLIDFERRGIWMRRDDDRLLVGPPELLTDDDRAILRTFKGDLLVLLDCCGRTDIDSHLFSDRPGNETAPRGRMA